MTRLDGIRATLAIAGLTAAQAAHADTGGITNAGWMSMVGIAVIAAVLFVVHKKMN